MRLGAIPQPRPKQIAMLSARARLSLHEPLPAVDWHAAAPADGDALGNNSAGCCVPAAEFRAIEMRWANTISNDLWKPTRDQVIARYSELTGYNPVTGQPDIGTDTAKALAEWSRTGLLRDPANSATLDVVLWAGVNHLNLVETKLAIGHTGPVQVTLTMPATWEDLSTWSATPGTGAGWEPGSGGGHQVMCGKYEGDTFTVRTWGMDIAVHPEWWAKYVLAVDATLSRQWMRSTGLAPSGLDWDALLADVASLS